MSFALAPRARAASARSARHSPSAIANGLWLTSRPLSPKRDSTRCGRTIDVQVSRLRKKIEGCGETLIKTVRNAGYMLCAAVEER